MNVTQLRTKTLAGRSLLEWGAALAVGALLGALALGYRYLPLEGDWQLLILAIPFVALVVILFNNLERLMIFMLALALPLNLDVSLWISPYSRNELNLASGNRTIVALTELRVSLLLLLVVIGYTLWLIEPRRRVVRLFPATTLPALGLIGVALLSAPRAADLQLAVFKIVHLVELFLAYFYLANHIRTRKELQFFVLVLMWAMLAESVLMIGQWGAGWGAPGGEMIAGRAVGTFITANAAAGILSAHLALVCAMLWLFSAGRMRLFALACFLLGGVALISTAGRAAWGGFVAAMAVLIVLGLRRGWVTRRAVLLLLLAAVALGAAFYPVIYTRLTEDDGGSAASRPMMFRLAWNIIQFSPANFFLGVGANNGALVAPAYNSARVGSIGDLVNSSTHNAYLLAWVETGLPGMLVFAAFLLLPMWRAFRLALIGDRYISLMALGLGAAILALSLQLFADPGLTRPKTLFLWLIIALVAGMENLAPAQSAATKAEPG